MSAMEITETPLTLVSLTESAAAKIRDLMAEEPAGEAEVLRIAVQGGGCSGFQYALGFDRGAQEDVVALLFDQAAHCEDHRDVVVGGRQDLRGQVDAGRPGRAEPNRRAGGAIPLRTTRKRWPAISAVTIAGRKST